MTDDVRETIDGPQRAAETDQPAIEVKPFAGVQTRGRPAVVPVVLVLLVLISGGVATWLYFVQFRPDQQTDQRVEGTVAKAAADGTTALLSYAPESLDADLASARSHLSGGFLDYYNRFTEQMVAPAARQKALKATASVKGAAVSQLRPDSAVVLVLVNQTTTSTENPNPSTSTSAVLVSMVRTDRDWLISKFEPL